MARLARAVVLLGLILLGWALGRAQTAAPDFELVVYGAPGDTQIVCRSGCKLAYRRDSGPIKQTAGQEKVGFACSEQGKCEVFLTGFVQH